jgi:hypothetical protein
MGKAQVRITYPAFLDLLEDVVRKDARSRTRVVGKIGEADKYQVSQAHAIEHQALVRHVNDIGRACASKFGRDYTNIEPMYDP